MRTAIHAVALLGAGYGLAWVFLTMTKPDTRSFCGGMTADSDNAHNAFTAIAPPPRSVPEFWEMNEPKTAALDAAERVYSDDEFRAPGHNVSSPLDPVFFLHEPEKFVQMFKDCEEDTNCYVTYHHVPKTGGTTIEAALSRVFGLTLESSCCNEFVLDLFRKNPEHYCQRKYTSWQMDYPLYFEVLDTCFQRNVNKKRRVLMLISYREVCFPPFNLVGLSRVFVLCTGVYSRSNISSFPPGGSRFLQLCLSSINVATKILINARPMFRKLAERVNTNHIGMCGIALHFASRHN